jgi:GTP-binding protein EngB required for normal cell division
MNYVTDVYSWLKKDSKLNNIRQLTDNKIIKVANDINSIIMETEIPNSEQLTLPQIVVVGTQSSGKSSVLNSIMMFDLLPTGKTMTTRTPLNIRLNQIEEKEAWVEFGVYDTSGWVTENKIELTLPNPTENEVTDVRKEIMKRTNKLAGTGMNISNHPIIMKVYSPNVPNLSLIDLPGLTMVACTDKGQPEDIKEKIEDLVVSYIKNKKTIVLAIMASRADMETDLGLALIKNHDKDGTRTIGVLTKPDLMNREIHVGNYLLNNISKNLMLTYGYYVVKNRSTQEMAEMDILEGIKNEKSYFTSHSEYKKNIYKDRVGIPALSSDLNKVLVTSISESLPEVMTKLMELEKETDQHLEKIGRGAPDTKEGKVVELNMYITNFIQQFIDSIEANGGVTSSGRLNIGKDIKDTFVKYRESVEEITPFTSNTDVYTEHYFKEIISSFVGNHMLCSALPINVVESCLKDPQHKPIWSLKEDSILCCENICHILTETVGVILKNPEFCRFPQLAAYLKNIVDNDFIHILKVNTRAKITELLKTEEDYIWTDDEEFRNTFVELSTKQMESCPDDIIDLLESYFTTVKKTTQNSVPKIIMNNLIRQLERDIQPYLYRNVIMKNGIELLKEDEKIEELRSYNKNLKDKISAIKEILESG